MIREIKHFFFLSCKRATGLIEKREHFGLSPWQKIQLRMHLFICTGCTRYSKQQPYLSELLRIHIQNQSEQGKEKLSEPRKIKILEWIRER